MNQKKRQKYLSLMLECQKRLESLYDLSSGRVDGVYFQVVIEMEALQLRKLLELIAFSSLITHEKAYEQVTKKIDGVWKAKNILKELEKINPDFYPVPIIGIKESGWVKLRGGFLTKKQFVALYDECSMYIHVRNPYRVRKKPLTFHEKVPMYLSKIENLLLKHIVSLAGSEGLLLVDVPHFKNSKESLRIRHLVKTA
ncbi:MULTISPECIES: hypothetical protein [Enterobacter]|uniref:Uncharacterized protein n=1 Tax=Enterobacter cancerogenus TaxID=69218 RepID=A0ABX8KKD2_9ENTR|nr:MULTISPECIES: hypothetical protein [Enterobacter]MBJ6543942.1 hypothetical protein [Enterobacter hormaechei]MBW4211165.1 hypothetical protein [Enterobacter asburiae]MDO2449444.1 hypothetical protein [Enterobacter vonholyi]QXA49495.1 hypothetical protein I6L58_00130 [Enterobacter cancerogenus]